MIGKKYTVREIAADLNDYIVKSELRPGTLLQPPVKLAERYNVSAQTVNRALDRLVKRGLVYRERGRGSFVAKRPEAAGLRVGLYLWQNAAQLGMDAFTNILLKELDACGFQVQMQLQLPEGKGHPECSDALIMPVGMCTEETLLLLKQLKIPVILIFGDRFYDYPYNQISFDYRPGFRRALEYLAGRNQRKLLIATWSGNSTIELRRQAIVECADEMGFEYEFLPEHMPTQFPYASTQWRLSYGREIARYYHQHKRREVIISPSDFLSFGIVDYMAENKLKPGRDYKLLSYDNLEKRGIMPFAEPMITAITHPQEEMAAETVKLLLNLLKDPQSQSYSYKVVRVAPTELVLRKTV